jgi:hypothetical protein
MSVLIGLMVSAVRSIFPCRLNQTERVFAAANRAFWQPVADAAGKPTAAYVLVEPNAQPIIRHCNATFAAIVAHTRGLRPLFIVQDGGSSAAQLLKSYHPDAEIVSLATWRYLSRLIPALFRAVRAVRQIRSTSALLEFTVDSIRFGDVVYDDILSKGYATVSRIDFRTFRSLAAFYWYRSLILDIRRRYQIETSVFSHTIGINSGTFARYLLEAGSETITRLGSHQIILKKSRSLDEVKVYPIKPEPAYFDWMLAHYDSDVGPLAEEYLEARFNQSVKQVAVDLAFNREKRLFTTRDEFCRDKGLDPARPTVFVMLHAFNDFPHSHFVKPMLYQDYYVWFRRTLATAVKVPDVNWVFKEHPAAAYYTTRDVDYAAIFGPGLPDNVYFLDRDADFNAASLRYLADAIVTCQGTVGMEYSSLGIPCVLAGESPYSGLGFTYEPASIADYERQLKEIKTLPRLNEDQIKRARSVMYFELRLLQETSFLFCPYFDLDTIMKMTADRFYGDAAAHLSQADPQALADQINSLAEFVRNDTCTQYINTEKFEFMRPVIDAGGK